MELSRLTSSGHYHTVNGHYFETYKVTFDAYTGTVSLQKATFNNSDYDLTDDIYVLRPDSASIFPIC